MSEARPDLAWVRRELGSINRNLAKAIDQWEPPSARDVMRDLSRVVRVLEELYPEPEWDEES
jgi:hypothetical protein